MPTRVLLSVRLRLSARAFEPLSSRDEPTRCLSDEVADWPWSDPADFWDEADEPPEDETPEDFSDEALVPELLAPELEGDEDDEGDWDWAYAAVHNSAAASPTTSFFMGVTSVPGER